MNLADFERKSIDQDKYINDNTFKFQILTWHAEDEEGLDSSEDEEELTYKIYMFGCTEEGHNVCLKIKDYTPYFYVRIPDHLQSIWNNFHTKELERNLRNRFKNNLKKVELQQKMNIKGFTNFKKENYIKLIFNNEKTYKFAKYYFRPINKNTKKVDINKLPRLIKIDREPIEFTIFEHNIDPYFRFCHRKDIPMAGWVQVNKKYLETPDEFVSICQLEFECSWKHVSPCEEEQQNNLSPFTVASFDIECVPKNRRSFPDPNNPDDIIFQIGTAFYKEGSQECLKHVLTIGSAKENFKCAPVEDIIVETFKTEKELLKRWFILMKNISPDIITGYNIYNFDWTYVNKRTELNKLDNELGMLSRLVSSPAKMENIKFQSSAYGTNYWHFVRIPGITNIDLHKIIKRDHKLESYKLNDVAFHFNGENKVDLTPEELFKCVDGTAKDIAKAVEYNAKDTELVAKLIQKLWILAKNISAANVSYIPLNFLEIKGQGIKIKSTTMHKCKKFDVLIPTADYAQECEDSFTGATVLDPEPGAYYKPLAGLDFASLYPSVMIAYNFCLSTLVKDKEYLNLPDRKYLKVDWVDTTGKECSANYVQDVKGIIPQILEELWQERKKYKKLMKTAKNSTEYNILNGIQLAVKVVMNSFYGILGATFGDLSERNIASSVTAKGREALQQAKHYAKKWYDCEVRYGDSVPSYTKLDLFIDHKPIMIQIDEIEKYTHNNWINLNDDEKEYLELRHLDVFTNSDKGYTKVYSVMRHLLHPSKKILKIKTETSEVEVTDDHSLILSDGTIISPKNLKLGDKLLTSKNSELNSVISITEVKYSGYVYDLTTENHHFSAGIGDIVVHNTDSIYVEFKTNKTGREHFVEVFRIAEEAAKRISDTFKRPMELEFEKIMYPFIIYNKKRYATVIWTNSDKYDYIDYKGIAVTRRDFCAFVRDRAREIIEKLLLHDIYEFKMDNPEENIRLAKEHAENIITRLLTGQVPIKELYISRSLRDGYKNENIPHVALRNKMRNRDPNNVPQIGDRVKYVFIQIGEKAKTQSEKVEDPDYVLKNGIPLDYYYYYEHQLKSTLESVLSNLGLDLTNFFGDFESKYKPVFTKWANKYAKEHAEQNGFTLDDFPKGMKIKKQDVIDKLKSKK